MSNPRSEDVGFDVDRILRETFVAEVVYHETVDSTNNAALEHCRGDKVRSPFLVLTSRQTSGRGRGKNLWWSPGGSLTFSLAIDAEGFGLPAELWPKASLTTGLSVCLAIESLLAGDESKVALKWPNDVHLQGRKLCGILIEVGPRSSGMLVIGIGVNVNNSFVEEPCELKSKATSLLDATGRRFNQTDVLTAVLKEIERQLSRLASADPGLAADWQTRCALRGRTVEVDTGKRRATGICLGIDEDGALVLSTNNGPKQIFGGTVTGIWSPGDGG